MLKVQVFCFLASYIVAFGLELARMLGKSRLHRAVILGFGTAGLLAHTAYLFNRGEQTHLPPLLSSMQDWLLVLAWTLVVFYLFLTAVRPELALGVFVLPVVLLFIASTYLMPEPTHDLLDAQRGLKMLHASLLVFGMGSVAGGFVAGLMYLVQHSRLKTRHPTRTGWMMPNLERLAQVNRWSVMLAFPLLTLGFATGVFLVLKVGNTGRHVSFNDPTVIGSGVLWILLAAVFVRLLTVNASTGKQVAWLTLCGCGFLILAVLGLQIIAGAHFAQNQAGPKTASVSPGTAVQSWSRNILPRPRLCGGEGRGEGGPFDKGSQVDVLSHSRRAVTTTLPQSGRVFRAILEKRPYPFLAIQSGAVAARHTKGSGVFFRPQQPVEQITIGWSGLKKTPDPFACNWRDA